MKIVYSLSVEDVIGWQRWADYHTPAGIRARRGSNIILAALGLIMPVAIVVTVYKNWDSQFTLWTSIIAAILIYFLSFLYCKNRAAELNEQFIRSTYVGRKSIGQFGQHSLEFQDEYLVEKNDAEQLFSKLIRISEILESPEHVLIVLFNGTHLIPRKKVESGDLDEFVKELRSRFSAMLESHVERENTSPKTAPKKKIQSGIYFFILAAVIAIPSLISFAIKSSAGPGDLELCAKIIDSCTNCERCKDFLRAEVFFYFSAPLAALLLIISLYKFYKNAHPIRPSEQDKAIDKT